MRELIEKKTEFMERIEVVLKKYNITKLYADRFYGHELAQASFYADIDNDEAYEELNSILYNPFNYSDRELSYGYDTDYLCTNELCEHADYCSRGDELIYDNGVWYKVMEDKESEERARCRSTYLMSSGRSMLIDLEVQSASDVKADNFVDKVEHALNFMLEQRCVIFCNMISEAIKYEQVDNAKKLFGRRSELFKEEYELQFVNSMLKERHLLDLLHQQ